MFSGRGYNIDTLNVAPTSDPKTSRMTIVVRGDDKVLEQVTKQLNKLVDVISVVDFQEGQYIDRELVLLQVGVTAKNRAEVIQICELFRAKIVDVAPDKLTVEITGDEQKVSRFILLMENFGVVDLTRTGKIALPRSE